MSYLTKSAVIGAAALTALFPAAGCSARPTKQITAFVAANATDPFNTLIKTYESSHQDVKVQANYAGTQILETQLEQGAEADLFLSADLSHIQKVRKEGLIDQFYPISRTHPVLIVPKNNPAGIQSLQDLANKSAKLIFGAESVPIGKYTRQVLEKSSAGYGPQFSKQVLSHVVSFETDVKQVLQKVAIGEADAGVVYRTDVTPELADKVAIIEIPSQYNVEGINYVAVLAKAPNHKLGEELLDLMRSPAGQSIFAKYGYDPLN